MGKANNNVPQVEEFTSLATIEAEFDQQMAIGGATVPNGSFVSGVITSMYWNLESTNLKGEEVGLHFALDRFEKRYGTDKKNINYGKEKMQVKICIDGDDFKAYEIYVDFGYVADRLANQMKFQHKSRWENMICGIGSYAGVDLKTLHGVTYAQVFDTLINQKIFVGKAPFSTGKKDAKGNPEIAHFNCFCESEFDKLVEKFGGAK